MTYALWIVQGLLALLFLFTGGVKLVLPIEVLTEQFLLPGLFVRFLGVAEVLGAVGLILPGLLGIRPGLTPLAAAGLLIIMMGATVITLAGAVPGGGVAPALIPLVVGLLSAFVAYGRWRLTPHRGVMGAGNAGSGQRPSTRGSRSAQFGVPNDGPGLYGGK
jgi:DoxX-like family